PDTTKYINAGFTPRVGIYFDGARTFIVGNLVVGKQFQFPGYPIYATAEVTSNGLKVFGNMGPTDSSIETSYLLFP
ncbi:MAG: hypothetical protein RR229_08345, partial [Oscillospiraceae bacterium]